MHSVDQPAQPVTTPATTPVVAAPTPVSPPTAVPPQTDLAQTPPSMYTQSSPMPNGTKGPSRMKQNNALFVVSCLIVLLGGIGTGAGINGLRAKSSNGSQTFQGQEIQAQPTGDIQVGEIFGNPSEDGFPDHIKEGVLQAGGFEGEGTHHLLRKGGVSQTVYLRSSVTDLDKFVGMKIEIWGQTDKPQKVGWLMDVGRIKVLELNAQPPVEEE